MTCYKKMCGVPSSYKYKKECVMGVSKDEKMAFRDCGYCPVKRLI